MGNILFKKTQTSTDEISIKTTQHPIKPKVKNTISTSTGKMDENNKTALKVLTTEGDSSFIKHVFTGDNGKKLTYAEMRDRYG